MKDKEEDQYTKFQRMEAAWKLRNQLAEWQRRAEGAKFVTDTEGNTTVLKRS